MNIAHTASRRVTANAALLTIAAVVLIGLSLPIGRASSQPQAVAVCTYRRCALGIAPTWNGLAVVRGVDGQRVANLNFFWPHDITAALSAGAGLAGAIVYFGPMMPDSAALHARRAFHLRRFAAVFTDAGLLLGGYAVAPSGGTTPASPHSRSATWVRSDES